MKWINMYKKQRVHVTIDQYIEFYIFFNKIEVDEHFRKNPTYVFDDLKANCILLMAAIKNEL